MTMGACGAAGIAARQIETTQKDSVLINWHSTARGMKGAEGARAVEGSACKRFLIRQYRHFAPSRSRLRYDVNGHNGAVSMSERRRDSTSPYLAAPLLLRLRAYVTGPGLNGDKAFPRPHCSAQGLFLPLATS